MDPRTRDARIRDLGTEDLYRDQGIRDPNWHALGMHVRTGVSNYWTGIWTGVVELITPYIMQVRLHVLAMYGMHPLKLIKYMHVALTPKTLRMQP